MDKCQARPVTIRNYVGDVANLYNIFYQHHVSLVSASNPLKKPL